MEEENFKNRQNISSLISRLRQLSEEDKSVQDNSKSIKNILTDQDLTYRNFHKFYHAIENSKQIEAKKSFYKNASRYAQMRVNWFLVDREEREGMHEERRSAHNVFIDSCNTMSRIMIKNGEDATWRKNLSDDRQVIGDFACYISFVLGIKAR